MTAWDNTNLPGYNAQCGQCIHVQNLQGSGDAYVTVIDFKGSRKSSNTASQKLLHADITRSSALALYQVLIVSSFSFLQARGQTLQTAMTLSNVPCLTYESYHHDSDHAKTWFRDWNFTSAYEYL